MCLSVSLVSLCVEEILLGSAKRNVLDEAAEVLRGDVDVNAVDGVKNTALHYW